MDTLNFRIFEIIMYMRKLLLFLDNKRKLPTFLPGNDYIIPSYNVFNI